ncbi:hypothetical protein [Alkalibacterium sp.]
MSSSGYIWSAFHEASCILTTFLDTTQQLSNTQQYLMSIIRYNSIDFKEAVVPLVQKSA